jgi:small-conductance mechanosensitive channel/CRP-like cAMP-binding protein
MQASPQDLAWVRFVIGLVVTYAVLAALDDLLFAAYLVGRRGLYLPRALRVTLQLALLGVIGLLLLRTLLDINVIALVAVPTVLTAVIGFALKDTLARLFEGISLGRLMQVGHWVSIGGREGRVTEIDLGHVTLQTRDDDYLIVPNNIAAAQEIVNFSQPDRKHACSVTVEAAYRHAPMQVAELLAQTIRNAPNVLRDPEPQAYLDAYNESGIQYRVKFWIRDYVDRHRVESEVRTYIWYAFDRHGIEIPFPQRVVHTTAATVPDPDGDRRRLAARLAEIDFLAGLSDEEIDRIAAAVARRVYLPGEVVIREGDSGAAFFCIEKGTAAVSVGTGASARPVAMLRAGEHFGEMSLLTGEPRSATVTATLELHVLVIEKAVMQALVRANPSLAERIGASLAARQATLAQVRQETPAAAAAAAGRPRLSDSFAERIRRFLGR